MDVFFAVIDLNFLYKGLNNNFISRVFLADLRDALKLNDQLKLKLVLRLKTPANMQVIVVNKVATLSKKNSFNERNIHDKFLVFMQIFYSRKHCNTVWLIDTQHFFFRIKYLYIFAIYVVNKNIRRSCIDFIFISCIGIERKKIIKQKSQKQQQRKFLVCQKEKVLRTCCKSTHTTLSSLTFKYKPFKHLILNKK